jgi:putative membrane protein
MPFGPDAPPARAAEAGKALFADLPLVCLYAVGLACHLIPSARPVMLRATPIALVLTAALVAASLAQERAGKAFAWAGAAFVAGFSLEAIGVATGAVFGSYSYGTALGPKLFAVPLVIGLNWAIVILGSVTLSRSVLSHPLAAATAAGILTAGFDWVMEPVAMRLGYWQWAQGTIPIRNYVAWFLIAAVLSFGFALIRPRVKTWAPAAAFVLQLVFFATLRIAGTDTP